MQIPCWEFARNPENIGRMRSKHPRVNQWIFNHILLYLHVFVLHIKPLFLLVDITPCVRADSSSWKDTIYILIFIALWSQNYATAVIHYEFERPLGLRYTWYCISRTHTNLNSMSTLYPDFLYEYVE